MEWNEQNLLNTSLENDTFLTMSAKFNKPVILPRIPLTLLVIIGLNLRTQANLIKLTFDPYGILNYNYVYIHSQTQNIITICQSNKKKEVLNTFNCFFDRQKSKFYWEFHAYVIMKEYVIASIFLIWKFIYLMKNIFKKNWNILKDVYRHN